ncbi:putative ring-cleavage extradiol dioxygenase [Sphaerochaeta pleomorpha str. Grapes]|uniref:Putative ring-cleavage extradiol dioxygenase n=1 Tax=Sphaerochaeta pleomorpha (strain ATCC BAA-1885 / DSM 22778 / Grapes) TaxID=158190 RepID=G8QT02_SPHPG|nr:VOC family protein [Sphaerochaeta pleomorpha]AEV27907.1 putative ring-cleavage extradiol dioxygenase [Sphaerochaeta pleomorpha str. Grapes]
MKFCWSTLTVSDMATSLSFYKEIVGLEIDNQMQVGNGTQIVFLGKGETKVELICHGGKKETDMGKDISLGFEVPSLDKQLALVQEKGIAVTSGPFQPNPFIRFFYVSDPDGLSIQFVEQLR